VVFLNSWRLRLWVMAAGILVAIGWSIFGGSIFPGSDCKVLIEFGSDPATFTGVAVEVDGRIAGRLEQVGATTRTAFPVACGTHRVRVLHPEFEPADLQIDANIPGVATMLLLDHADVPRDGRPGLTLRP
jgi:hypothetical protein